MIHFFKYIYIRTDFVGGVFRPRLLCDLSFNRTVDVVSVFGILRIALGTGSHFHPQIHHSQEVPYGK